MKEAVFREAPRAEVTLPDSVATEFSATRRIIVKRSAVAWGEHCTECAFPSCYSTCDFYSPRLDLHCRRFEDGIESLDVANHPELTGLTRIAFRRWGKLEGTGPAALLTKASASRRERQTDHTSTFLVSLPLPRAIGPGLVHRLNLRRRALSEAVIGIDRGAVFVVETFLQHPGSITMALSMAPWDPTVRGLFQTTVTLKHGYNRLVVPVEAISVRFPLEERFYIRLEVVGAVPDQPVIFGLTDFATLDPAAVLPARVGFLGADSATESTQTAKVVVWDLDDTVWQGTLVEDGIDGLVLNDAAVRTIRILDERGILNSVASKNDESLALKALEQFGLSDYLLHPQIGWGPKSDSVRRIAEFIGVGLDTVVFVDDQPFERAEVLASLPKVTVMTPPDDVECYTAQRIFTVPVTADASVRRTLYRNEEKRKAAADQTSSSYTTFLKMSHIVLEISAVTGESAERVYELSQRTNQLNVSGSRFTRDEVRRFAEGTTPSEGYVLSCRDNYGTYGVVGFCVLNPQSGTVEAFFLSCRVQRKCVESAFFKWLADARMPSTARELRVRFRRTEKNSASVSMLENLGFSLVESQAGHGYLIRDLAVEWTDFDIVAIEDRWM